MQSVTILFQFCVLNTMQKREKQTELTQGLLSSPRESANTVTTQQTLKTSPKKLSRGILAKYRKVEEESDEPQIDFKKKNSHSMDKELKKRKFSWPIWKKLFGYALKRKFHFLLGLALNICFAMSISILPLKVGNVLDEITTTSSAQTDKNVEDLKNGVFELGIMTILLAIFTFTRFLSLQFLQEFLAMDMKNDFFRKFMENDMYFFQQYKSGQLVSRLSSDVNQAKSAVSNNVTFMIRNFVIIVSNIIILFTISAELTSMIMLLVPFYCFLTFQYSRRNKILVRAKQDVEAEIAAAVTEKFSGIQLVKAYSTEESQIDNYGSIIIKGYNISKKKIFLTAIYNSFSQFLPYIGIMTVLWYGGSEVIKGSTELTAGELTSFILYCTSLAHSTSAIANSYTNIINGTYAVQKVFEMLDYTPLVDESKGQQLTITGDIEFRNVTFQYPSSNTTALTNLSFKIKQGEYIAFVGESGSGKSTIIKLIEKFYQIKSGNVYYGIHEQADINAIYLRKQIGLVNQDATMFSGTIQSNIAYGLDQYTPEEMEQVSERAGCLEFLNDEKRFPEKFQSQVGEKGNNLSGGQKQRLSIARALMRKPKVIIFDEATSALDSNSQRMVQQSIQNLAKNNRADKPTIIVIAHRLSTIINANRIFVMKNGQIKEVGSHRQLLEQKGYYYQLIEKQLGDSPKLENSPECLKSEQISNKM